MSLAPSIVSHVVRVCELGSQQGSHLHDMRRVAKVLNDQALTKLLSELQSLQASLQAECNAIKAEVGAAQMTGEYVKPTIEARDMELHPTNLPLPHPELPREQAVWTGAGIKPQGSLTADELMRMQATLHRAGDHTLDEEVKS